MVNAQRILSVNKVLPAWKSVSQIRYKASSLPFMKHQIWICPKEIPIIMLNDSFPGDAKSIISAQAAGLAVEKPGGTFSVTDSALGKSSYTVSTAGVTMLSEVS